MKDIFTVSLADILPANIANAPNIPPVIAALDPLLQKLSQESLSPSLITNIDTAPSQSLDHIAITLASDLYGYALDDESRREILKASITRHMKKGTAAEIIRALKTVGVNAKFIPWFDEGAQPYTFRIVADIDGDFYKGRSITGIITRIINETKSARSFLMRLDTNLADRENLLLFTGTADSLSGSEVITLSRDEIISHDVLYYGGLQRISGGNAISLQRDNALRTSLYAGIASPAFVSAEEWIDDDTLQELLLQFEQRIFSRIDALENKLDTKIDARTKNLDDKIDSVIELLRWKNTEDD